MELAKTIVSGRPVPEDTDAEPETVAVKPPRKKKTGPFLKLEKPRKKKRPEPEDPIAVLLQNAGADDTTTKVNGNGKKTKTKPVEVEVEASDEDDEAEEAESNGVVVIDDEESRRAAREAWEKEDKEVRAWEVVSICAYISGWLGSIGLFIGFNSTKWFPFYLIAAVAYFAVGTLAGLILLHFCQWCDESIRGRALQCWNGAVRRLCYVGAAFTWILRK